MEPTEKRYRINWIRDYGPELGLRITALDDRCGYDAVLKFLDAKLYGVPLGGFYISRICRSRDGVPVLCALLDRLLSGELVRVISLTAYYANNCRIPPGMQIIGDQLVDVLDPLMNPRDDKEADAV